MGTSQEIVYEFMGSFASLTGGGLLDANLLNVGSGPLLASIRDQDGVLSQSDDGISSFSLLDGSVSDQPIDYIGSGTMSTIGLLGLTLDSRAVTAFSVNGQIYLIAPQGFPLLSGLSITFDIDPSAPYALSSFVPCLVEGTLILTPGGFRPIEDIDVGDPVLDHCGATHRVLWRGSRHVAASGQNAPVRVPKDIFGYGTPFVDTWVSQQHRLVVSFREFGDGFRFARAKLLIEDGLYLDESAGSVTYHHLLFDRHIVMIANGMPTESLLAAKGTRMAFGETFWNEISRSLITRNGTNEMRICLPDLGRGELSRRRKRIARNTERGKFQRPGAVQINQSPANINAFYLQRHQIR